MSKLLLSLFLVTLTACGLPKIPDIDPYVIRTKQGVGIKCFLVDKEKLEFKCDPNIKKPLSEMDGYFAISSKQTSEAISWIRNTKENYRCEPK